MAMLNNQRVSIATQVLEKLETWNFLGKCSIYHYHSPSWRHKGLSF